MKVACVHLRGGCWVVMLAGGADESRQNQKQKDLRDSRRRARRAFCRAGAPAVARYLPAAAALPVYRCRAACAATLWVDGLLRDELAQRAIQHGDRHAGSNAQLVCRLHPLGGIPALGTRREPLQLAIANTGRGGWVGRGRGCTAAPLAPVACLRRDAWPPRPPLQRGAARAGPYSLHRCSMFRAQQRHSKRVLT